MSSVGRPFALDGAKTSVCVGGVLTARDAYIRIHRVVRTLSAGFFRLFIEQAAIPAKFAMDSENTLRSSERSLRSARVVSD